MKVKIPSAYAQMDMFLSEIMSMRSEKSPSVLALERLARSKPALAKAIFKEAALATIEYYLAQEPAPVEGLSAEGKRRIEELSAQFTQEPRRALILLEAVLTIEKVEPWTASLARDFKMTLEEARQHDWFYRRAYATACHHALSAVGGYVRERDYRIALALVAAIDGTSTEAHLRQIIKETPRIEGHVHEFYGEATKSLIGTDGIQGLVSWVCGDLHF